MLTWKQPITYYRIDNNKYLLFTKGKIDYVNAANTGGKIPSDTM